MNDLHKIIDVDDEPREDDRPQDTPEITIEEDPESASPSPRSRRRYLNLALWLILALAIVGTGVYFLQGRSRYDVEASCSDEDNIALLRGGAGAPAKGTVVTTDSVLGVAFDMYSLRGLRGGLERQIPDTADNSLVLFMRSADYLPDGRPLGSLVAEGELTEGSGKKYRPGYVALSAEGVPVIGISFSNKVSSYVRDNGGSFFRQYVLLGEGELPSRFELHGKVERAALVRMSDGEMFYIVTRHPETMYDFADALREYGVMDAVYITGGDQYTFHRTCDGVAHINDKVRAKVDKYSDTVPPTPFLVFRTAIP